MSKKHLDLKELWKLVNQVRSPSHKLNKIKCDRNLTATEAIAKIQSLTATTSDSRDDNWIDRNLTAAEAIAKIQSLNTTTSDRLNSETAIAFFEFVQKNDRYSELLGKHQKLRDLIDASKKCLSNRNSTKYKIEYYILFN